MSLASDRPEFTPPSTSGRGRAIGLAVLAHAFLIAALTWGVSWKREANNAPIMAELWSATAQQAAPALVEPAPPQPQIEPQPEPKVEPPTPPAAASKPVKVIEPEPELKIDPQIAIEKAKKEEKRKLDKKKADEAKALAKQQAEEEAEEEARLEALNKKKRDLEAKKLEAKKAADAKKTADAKAAANDAKYDASLKASREANLKRIAGQAGASGGETATGTAKQSTGPSAGYSGRLSARLRAKIVFNGASDISGNPIATVEVRTSPDGTITGRTLTRSSGVKAWDDAVLRAIDRTEILPLDVDGRIPAAFPVNFGPKD
jgi:colicin import membrane protein